MGYWKQQTIERWTRSSGAGSICRLVALLVVQIVVIVIKNNNRAWKVAAVHDAGISVEAEA